MERKRMPLRIVLSVLLSLLLAYRVAAVVLDADNYRSFWRFSWSLGGWSLDMYGWMLVSLVLMLACILVVQWGPFLVLGFSILAQWARPPVNRNLYVLCIAVCGIVFLGEGGLYFVNMLRMAGHVCEMPLMNLAVALIDGIGILFVSGRDGQG